MQHQSNESNPSQTALQAFIDRAGGANLEWTSSCNHLHDWHDFVLNPSWAEYRDEGALLASQRARVMGDYEYAAWFAGQAEASDERIHAEVSAYARTPVHYSASTYRGDNFVPMRARDAAALAQFDAYVAAFQSQGDVSYLARAHDALADALETSTGVAAYAFHTELATTLAFQVPDEYAYDASEHRQYFLANHPGPSFVPHWDNVYEEEGDDATIAGLLEDAYVSYHGAGPSYALAGSVARWHADPIPWCHDASFPSTWRPEAEAAIDAWRDAGNGRVAFAKDASCDYSRSLVFQTGDAEGRDGVARPDVQFGVTQSCRVEVRTGLPSHAWPRTLLHELGHCIGLPHSAYEGNIMSYRLPPAPAVVTAADATTLTEAWDSPVLTLSMGRGQVDPNSRTPTGNEAANVTWRIHVDIAHEGASPVTQLFVDVDGDLVADQVVEPGTEFSWTYTRYGPVTVTVDVVDSFTSPAMQASTIAVRR